jgi:hypothetical protein
MSGPGATVFSNTPRAAVPGTLARRALLRNATSKDFEVSRIMGDIVDVVADHHGVAAIP